MRQYSWQVENQALGTRQTALINHFQSIPPTDEKLFIFEKNNRQQHQIVSIDNGLILLQHLDRILKLTVRAVTEKTFQSSVDVSTLWNCTKRDYFNAILFVRISSCQYTLGIGLENHSTSYFLLLPLSGFDLFP